MYRILSIASGTRNIRIASQFVSTDYIWATVTGITWVSGNKKKKNNRILHKLSVFYLCDATLSTLVKSSAQYYIQSQTLDRLIRLNFKDEISYFDFCHPFSFQGTADRFHQRSVNSAKNRSCTTSPARGAKCGSSSWQSRSRQISSSPWNQRITDAGVPCVARIERSRRPSNWFAIYIVCYV